MAGTAEISLKLNTTIKHVKQLEKDMLAMKEVLKEHLERDNYDTRLDPGGPLNEQR